MVLSEAQKHDAYREAQQILRLSEKWQELMPGERKPNFHRAAQEVLKRALGHTTSRHEEPLDIHGGLMHEHGPREARLLERTLRAGVIHPDALHSFQHGITKKGPVTTSATTRTCPTSRCTCTTTARPSTTPATTSPAPASTTPAYTNRPPLRACCRSSPPRRGCPARTRPFTETGRWQQSCQSPNCF